MPNKSCPCEFNTPCSSTCSCANQFMSGGCRRCCKYGSVEQQEKAARILIAQENLALEAIRALEAISLIGGNLPDDRLTSKTGANDAVARGIMYTSARGIALSYLEYRKSLLDKILPNEVAT